MYFDKLDHIINKYNIKCHSTIKTTPVDVKSRHILTLTKKKKIRILYLKLISKYENIFVKGWTLNWSEEVFVVTNVKQNVPWPYVTADLNGEEMFGK